MPHASPHDISPMELRQRAATRLRLSDGPAETGARAARSLAALHALASSPDTAGDALALLHELQVHQVELDLQAEELRDSRVELEADLQRQMALLECLPVACFCIDRQCIIRELNRAGAVMLGLAREDACGRGLDTWLASGDLSGLVSRLGEQGHASGTLRWRVAQGAPQNVHAEVGRDPSGQGYVVVLVGAVGSAGASAFGPR